MPDSFDEYKCRMEAEGYHIAMQPIIPDSGRFPLPKPYKWDDRLTSEKNEEKWIIQACKEGAAMLEAETAPPKAKAHESSVKADHKNSVQDNLASKSSNPYARARAKILGDMLPSKREQIDKIERGELPKDATYDKFCKQVFDLGDKLSDSNN